MSSANRNTHRRFKKRTTHPKNFRRFHYKIWFPHDTGTMLADFFEAFEEVNLTNHAYEQLIVDKRDVIHLPTKADITHYGNTLVEFYEVIDELDHPTGIVQKALIRVHHIDSEIDFSYVVSREGYIISAWTSYKDDIHRLTASAHLYWCPETIRDERLAVIQKEADEYKAQRLEPSNEIDPTN